MRPSPATPALLLLDAMGTLLRLAAPVGALRHEIARRFGVTVSEAEAGQALAKEILYYRTHLQEAATAQTLDDLRVRCARVLRSALPSSPVLDAVPDAELTRALLAALRFEAFPDAAPALAAARDRGQRTIVVSNWDCSLPDVLARAGLRTWLDGVLTSAEVGAAKPEPLIFERALELAGCLPAEALHIGDSLDEDVAGARSVGVPVLLLARDGRPGPGGVRTIRGLNELDALLGMPGARPNLAG